MTVLSEFRWIHGEREFLARQHDDQRAFVIRDAATLRSDEISMNFAVEMYDKAIERWRQIGEAWTLMDAHALSRMIR